MQTPLIFSALLALSSGAFAQAQAPAQRLRLRLDTTEAVAVLHLMADTVGTPVADRDWQAVVSSEPYRRLHDREAAMKRPFTDSSFAAFVRSDTLRQRGAALRHTLSEWEHIDLPAQAARAFAYLPDGAHISASVYIVIKPRTNSFVWESKTNPAIFLYLDPTRTAAQVANTIAHELHHIGYATVSARTDSAVSALPDSVRAVAEWVSAFGEGFAMLAAAGGPGVHPHAASPDSDRTRWDSDVSHFNANVRDVNAFFLDLLHHRYPSADSAEVVGMSFFGVQGPWYTVGWKMAVMIERDAGRAELIRCMLDPHRLLATYNRLASRANRARPGSRELWSAEIVSALAPIRVRP